MLPRVALPLLALLDRPAVQEPEAVHPRLAQVDDVIAEWEDRYGPLPPEAEELIAVARLRVEALRIGLDELVQARGEIRISPVDLRPSQEVRLERIQRGAVLRGEKLFIPAPKSDVAKALHTFLQTMWPETAG